MRIQEIRELIQLAVDDENRTSRLAEVVKTTSQKNGRSLNNEEIDGVVNFIRDYIECVPNYLEEWISTAQLSGLEAVIAPVITQLENYWFEVEDAIPDHLGLMGYMDDAYYSLVSLQGMSDNLMASTGRSLLKHNLTQINESIGKLIGEPVVSHLVAQANNTIGQTTTRHMLNQIGLGVDPSFGHKIRQLASEQLLASDIGLGLAGDPTTPAPPPESNK